MIGENGGGDRPTINGMDLEVVDSDLLLEIMIHIKRQLMNDGAWVEGVV